MVFVSHRTWISIFLAIIPSAFADVWMGPRNLNQVGIFDTQMGFLLTDAHVLIADYDLLRKDFPSLQDTTDSEIDEIILADFAYQSYFTTELDGILVEFDHPKHKRFTGKRTTYSPKGYGRASVAGMRTILQSGAVNQRGVFDLKGTGLSLLREVGFAKILAMLADLTGEPSGPYDISRLDLKELQAEEERLGLELAELDQLDPKRKDPKTSTGQATLLMIKQTRERYRVGVTPDSTGHFFCDRRDALWRINTQ